MRTWTRAVAATMGALAVAAALTGCNSASEKGSGSAGATASGDKADTKASYRLGEASPPQESTGQATKGATYTVTPTKVRMGTEADVKASGVQLEASDGPQVPVYVSFTLTHKSGKAMIAGDMDDDLVVATDKGQRTKALIVLIGQAKWPNCPASDTEKRLSPGQSADICSVFLIPAGQTATAVELTQGFYADPLKWPVKS
jgi:hypothetical protein